MQSNACSFDELYRDVVLPKFSSISDARGDNKRYSQEDAHKDGFTRPSPKNPYLCPESFTNPTAKSMSNYGKIIIAFILTAAAVCAAASGALAQGYFFRQIAETHLLRNPAYAGAQEQAVASAAGRLQWLNMTEGENGRGPRTYAAMFDLPVEQLGGGLGAAFLRDQNGPFTANEFRLNYAYRARLGDEMELRFGASPTLRVSTLDGYRLNAADPNDPTLEDRTNQKSTNTELAFAFGGWFRFRDLRLGASVADVAVVGSGAFSSGERARRFYANAAYDWQVADFLEISPAVLTRHFFGDGFDRNMSDFRLTAGLPDRRLFAGVNVTYIDYLDDAEGASPGFGHATSAIIGGRPIPQLELAALIEWLGDGQAYEVFGPSAEVSASWFFGAAE